MRSRCIAIVACAACASCSNDMLTQENTRLTAELSQCKTESHDLQRSVNDLKKRLALAIADQQPRSQGDDEDVARRAAGNVKQGTIEQDEVIRTVDQSKGA